MLNVIEIQFTPVYNGGLFTGWIYIFEDITSRKNAEELYKKV